MDDLNLDVCLIDGDIRSASDVDWRILEIAKELGNPSFLDEAGALQKDGEDEKYYQLLYEIAIEAAEWLSSLAPEGYYFGNSGYAAWGFWRIDDDSV